MKQKHKSVYFPDYPAESSNQKALTLAFGKHSDDLYQDVHGLSSAEMRQLLGTDSYQTLLDTASAYMGKLKPAIAHTLVRTFVPDGG